MISARRAVDEDSRPLPPSRSTLAPGHPATRAATIVVEEALASSRTRRILVALLVALVISTVLAVGLGPVMISPGDVLRIIGHHLFGQPQSVDWSLADDAIIWQVRLPRVLLGVVVGSALAVTGMALQAIVRNPLAEPHLLGVSAGASTGAAAAILFGVGAVFGANSTSAVAFLGALGAMVLMMMLARTGGVITPGKMLVAGIAVGYLLSAVTSLLTLFADAHEGARAVLFWLLGSLTQADWQTLPLVTIVVTATILFLWCWRRRLDVLAVGDDLARSVGVDPDRTRLALVVAVALCVGASVAVAGGIAFVGLAVPHVARRFVGQSHRAALPACALLGGILLVWADVIARMVIQPRELPIGVVTALIGAPVLVVLVRRLHVDRA